MTIKTGMLRVKLYLCLLVVPRCEQSLHNHQSYPAARPMKGRRGEENPIQCKHPSPISSKSATTSKFQQSHHTSWQPNLHLEEAKGIQREITRANTSDSNQHVFTC